VTRSIRRASIALWRSISSAASDGCEPGTASRIAFTEADRSRAERLDANLPQLSEPHVTLACMQASIAPPQGVGEQLAASFATLLKAVSASGGQFFTAVEELGLSLSQLKAMHVLGDAQEPLALGALGERIGLSPAAVSRSTDGLVRRGFVSRRDCPEDRRSKRLELTAKGRRTGEQLFALRMEGFRELVAQLEPEERAALASALEPVVRRLAP
jgi:DNA-binding MarR family transcriptional regulator